MRIGYVCKYVPTEALEAMGAHMERIEPDESLVSFDAAESCMHANVCSFAKATFETVLSGNLDGIVLTTCCDSMRRLAGARLREVSFRSCAAFIPPREVELCLAKFRQQQPGGGLGRMERRLRSF